MIVSALIMNCFRKSSVVLCVFILFMTACKEQDKKQKEEKAPAATTTPAASFINPPIKGVDVPYQEYSVDAAKGDTLIYPTGSIILFPPNAFVDEAGKPVTGNVQVKYREFKDPVDFFLAGIPMQYDSGGVAYQFESSGMFDIRAFKEGKPVFVNKANKPEVNIVSKNNSNKHSLYFLDTVQGKWINKGGMLITERRDAKKATKPSKSSTEIATEELPEPVKPLKADNKSPVLKIEVDPSSFKEFAIYKNLKFQVDESKTRFNTRDSEEEWNNLELLKGSQPGTYIAKFSNAGKTVSYAVKPVFTGEDYETALKVFEKKHDEFKVQQQVRAEKELAQQKAREKEAQALYVKDSMQNAQVVAYNKKIDMLNAIIAKKNLLIEKQNALIAKRNAEVMKRREIYEKRMDEYVKQREIENKVDNIYRSMSLDGFGVWNSDIASKQNTISLIATFKDKNGKELSLANITVINRSVNSILAVSAYNVLLVPGAENMILATYDGKLVYVSFDEYKKLNIKDDKEQTFIVEVVEGSNLNYDYIKSLFKKAQ